MRGEDASRRGLAIVRSECLDSGFLESGRQFPYSVE